MSIPCLRTYIAEGPRQVAPVHHRDALQADPPAGGGSRLVLLASAVYARNYQD